MNDTTKKNKLTINASIFRIVLSIGMVLIVVLGFFIWKYGTGYLKDVGANVAKINQESESSNSAVSQLQNLESELKQTSEEQQKAKNIVAQSQGYQFQDQITADIQRFANSSGITIDSFTYSGGTTGDAPAAASGQSAAGQPTSPTAQIAGLTPVTVTIGLKSPLNYASYVAFLHDIEQNSLKMQIAGLSLTSDTSGLTSQDLMIQAYIKK